MTNARLRLASAEPESLAVRTDELLALRTDANERFFERESERIAELCFELARRFARGGRLLAFGESPQARSDARHVSVEFVHPVIVGKRALPAIAIGPEGGPLAAQVGILAGADDMAIAFEPERSEDTAAALAAARARGCLTIAFADADADWVLDPRAEDAFVAQELAETAYHVLWELVHVFFEHKGLLSGRSPGPVHDPGRSTFLYPFLTEQEHDLEGVLADVRASVLAKARDVAELRVRTVVDSRETLASAAASMREALDAGGTVLAFGNGGSATDAADLVADLRSPRGAWPARRALDLAEDAGILSALANDIGPEVLFARQIIAYGRAGDVAVAFSTSGGSANVIEALREARRRKLATIAFVGYDGGRIVDEELADHVVVSPSQHIPRIQEAQATGYHILRELVETR